MSQVNIMIRVDEKAAKKRQHRKQNREYISMFQAELEATKNTDSK